MSIQHCHSASFCKRIENNAKRDTTKSAKYLCVSTQLAFNLNLSYQQNSFDKKHALLTMQSLRLNIELASFNTELRFF